MKAKKQLRYLLDRSYLDCSEVRSGNMSISLLLHINIINDEVFFSDGINSIKTDFK